MVADTNGTGPELVKALVAAKKKFKPLVKNKVNPHFKSKYADLAALHEAVDDALGENGLTVMQPLCFDEKDRHIIRTMLIHTSGQSMQSVYPLPGGVKSQELASAITYGRRYSLSSLLGIPADDDDDGEAEQGRSSPPQDVRKKEEPKPEKRDPSWSGTIAAVEDIPGKKGMWKVTGGDTTTFATSSPEIKAKSVAASETLIRVTITYRMNQAGSKIMESIEEVKQ